MPDKAFQAASDNVKLTGGDVASAAIAPLLQK